MSARHLVRLLLAPALLFTGAMGTPAVPEQTLPHATATSAPRTASVRAPAAPQRAIAAAAASVPIPGSQPSEERAAQDQLPMSHNPVWTQFLRCKVSYNQKSGLYSIAVTPDIKALAGHQVTLTGFVLPLDASDHTKHFLLTRRTPVCMFCPPGEPNEVVEVVSPRPTLWTDKMVTVTGTIALVNNGENGIFFKIADATVR